MGSFYGRTGTSYNCCSMGSLKANEISQYGTIDYLMKRGSEFLNSYYLKGIYNEDLSAPEEGVISFVKTSANSEDMTSQKVVNALNQYIDDHKNDEDAETNTSEWLRWRVGANGLPELIFDF